MPSWCGLTHFDQVVSIDFTDATKLEHLWRSVVWVIISVIVRMESGGVVQSYGICWKTGNVGDGDEQPHVLHTETTVFAFFSCFIYSPSSLCFRFHSCESRDSLRAPYSHTRAVTVLFSPHSPQAASSPHISLSIQIHGTQLSRDLSCSRLASHSRHRHMSHEPHLALALGSPLQRPQYFI